MKMEKKNLSHFSGLKSHPEKPLEQHLLGAYRWAYKFLCNETEITKNKEIKDTILLACLFHDIGKATKYFQQLLIQPKNTQEPELAKHSLFSAVFTLYILSQRYYPNCGDINSLKPFLAYAAVRKHHSDLINIYYLANDITVIDDELLIEQAKSIEENQFKILIDQLRNEVHELRDFKVDIRDFISWLQKGERERLFKGFRKLIRKLDEGENNIGHYLEMNLIYSMVTDADLMEIFLGSEPYELGTDALKSEIVEKYIAKNLANEKSKINHLRTQAFEEVRSKTVNPSKRLYLLNLPTGIGKTLISFYFALRIRDTLGKRSRIIYALPFLSIIEQNHSVIDKVLRNSHINPTLEILIKHHHLSDLYYYSNETWDDISNEYKKFQLEGWNSEIVVTTFVQLFHTIFSHRKRMLRRFNRLSNSIIILDEIQAIPVKYWDLVKKTLSEVSESLNSYIILSTATAPLIFDNQKETLVELCEPKRYYLSLNRVKMKIDYRNWTLEEFKAKYADLIKDHGGLVIFNTIGSAKTFYNSIKETLEKPSTFLSTHVIPKTRKERIEKIRTGQFQIAVTTQLIEAGVDIDFPLVIRDIAPLDSLIQSAGRCNRNGLNFGKFFVVHLVDGNNRLFADYVYDRILIETTKEILKDNPEYMESDFPKLIDRYYRCIQSRKSQDISREFLDAMRKLNYASDSDEISIKDFKLIEEDVPKVPIFIEYDEEAREIWKFLMENVLPKKDPLEKRRLFNRIKVKFYEYLISVPKTSKNLPKFVAELELYHVPYDELELYYDQETGYKISDNVASTLCI
ncbi:MAG: CRISPR-associated helicase Cas3' [candidate division WOR-3 bacterium]